MQLNDNMEVAMAIRTIKEQVFDLSIKPGMTTTKDLGGKEIKIKSDEGDVNRWR